MKDQVGTAADATDPIRIVVVSAVRAWRDALSLILGDRPEIQTAVSVPPTREIAERLAEDPPDVVVYDTAGNDALAGARTFVGFLPNVPLLCVGVPAEPRNAVLWAEAGAAAYCFEDASLDEMVSTIGAARRHETPCPPWLTAALVRRLRTIAAGRRSREPESLTARERQILSLVARGLSNKQIASRLQIETSTVKNHVHNVLRKLNVRRRSEAAAHALEQSEEEILSAHTRVDPP